MSSIGYQDKENALQRPQKDQNAENPVIRQKGNARKSGLRVPLGGKDQNNAALPALQRSKLSLNTTHVRQAKAPFAKPPALLKANSLLGFAHSTLQSVAAAPRSPKRRLEPKNWQAQKLLNHQHATRSKELQAAPVTDSLVKKQPKLLPVPSALLKDTLSPATDQLHASRLPATIRVGDPTKSDQELRAKSDLINAKLIEELSNDPSSVEMLPPKQVKHQPPDGLEPLDQDDVDFFVKPTRTALTDENAYEFDEIHRNEVKLQFTEIDLDDSLNLQFGPEGSADESSGPVGLTTKELNDLLDY